MQIMKKLKGVNAGENEEKTPVKGKSEAEVK